MKIKLEFYLLPALFLIWVGFNIKTGNELIKISLIILVFSELIVLFLLRQDLFKLIDEIYITMWYLDCVSSSAGRNNLKYARDALRAGNWGEAFRYLHNMYIKEKTNVTIKIFANGEYHFPSVIPKERFEKLCKKFNIENCIKVVLLGMF